MKRGNRKKAKMTIPLAMVAGLVGGPIAATLSAKDRFGGDWMKGIVWEGGALAGYDTDTQRWAGLSQMKKAGYAPMIAGFGVHWLAGKLGVNRMLGRAGIPFIRI